eukprot:TRINITY_DN6157_c0_g1_i3.p1 TRINITY_DN6157_c0_g1~~TRINITY_DN6157_c0_g1_i3.p1  ORF type:complete len:240 (-),score=50.90 TRINITY_DN6157_c0_g1_i3:570-1289(-)
MAEQAPTTFERVLALLRTVRELDDAEPEAEETTESLKRIARELTNEAETRGSRALVDALCECGAEASALCGAWADGVYLRSQEEGEGEEEGEDLPEQSALNLVASELCAHLVGLGDITPAILALLSALSPTVLPEMFLAVACDAMREGHEGGPEVASGVCEVLASCGSGLQATEREADEVFALCSAVLEYALNSAPGAMERGVVVRSLTAFCTSCRSVGHVISLLFLLCSLIFCTAGCQ